MEPLRCPDRRLRGGGIVLNAQDKFAAIDAATAIDGFHRKLHRVPTGNAEIRVLAG